MSKFSDDTCEALYDLSLDGCLDDECGDVSEAGEWYGLLVNNEVDGAEHAILFENSQGFVEYTVYESEEQARNEFARVQREMTAACGVEETMSNLAELCEKHNVTVTYGKGEIRDTDDSGRRWRHVRFLVTLKRGGTYVVDYGAPFHYHMGFGEAPSGYEQNGYGLETAKYNRYLKTRVPDVASVVSSLLSDASCYDSARDFADYCADMGFSTDSIRARDTYLECGETAKRIRAFLGDLLVEFEEAARDF